jgi:hypothetical protein
MYPKAGAGVFRFAAADVAAHAVQRKLISEQALWKILGARF